MLSNISCNLCYFILFYYKTNLILNYISFPLKYLIESIWLRCITLHWNSKHYNLMILINSNFYISHYEICYFHFEILKFIFKFRNFSILICNVYVDVVGVIHVVHLFNYNYFGSKWIWMNLMNAQIKVRMIMMLIIIFLITQNQVTQPMICMFPFHCHGASSINYFHFFVFISLYFLYSIYSMLHSLYLLFH